MDLMILNHKLKNFYKSKENEIECNICIRNCRIKTGKKGFCEVILNKNNSLYSTDSFPISKIGFYTHKALNISSITLKEKIFVVGTWGCNFKCIYCINYEWSYALPPLQKIKTFFSPEEIINLIKKENSKSLCFSVNESTIYFDLLLKTFKLAKENGIRTLLCTNGALSSESLRNLYQHTDLFRIDIKGFSPKSYRRITGLNCFSQIKKNIEFLFNKKKPIELTFLPVPELNDHLSELKEMIGWIKNMSPEIPFHILKFIPSSYAINYHFVSEKYLNEIFRLFVKNGLKSVERED